MKCDTTCTTTLSSEAGCVKQVSTKEQFNNSPVLGMHIQGNIVPVFYHVDMGGGNYIKGPVYYGPRYHECFLWKDNAYSACCRTVMKFNVKHFTKCYLPGTLDRDGLAITTPYTFNCCDMCGSSIDGGDCPRIYEKTTELNWKTGNNVFRACEIRQEETNCDEAFPTTVVEKPQVVYTGEGIQSIIGKDCK